MVRCAGRHNAQKPTKQQLFRSWINTGSVVCLCTPVSPSMLEMEGTYATGSILFWGCTFGGVFISCINSHARWSYRRRFRSLLLCPLSVEFYYFSLLGESTERQLSTKLHNFVWTILGAVYKFSVNGQSRQVALRCRLKHKASLEMESGQDQGAGSHVERIFILMTALTILYLQHYVTFIYNYISLALTLFYYI